MKFLVAEMSPVPLSLAVGYDPKSRQSLLVGPTFGASEKTATNSLLAERRMYQDLRAAGEVAQMARFSFGEAGGKLSLRNYTDHVIDELAIVWPLTIKGKPSKRSNHRDGSHGKRVGAFYQ